MKKRSPLENRENSGVPDLVKDDEPSDTSFIRNIQIDVPDKEPSGVTNAKTGNSGITNANNLRTATSRTTTLALDPRPFRRRERFYTTIISILTITVLLLSGLLIFILQQSINPAASWEINIAGVEVNREILSRQAEKFMQQHTGALVKIDSQNERFALAELARGRVQLVQLSHKLTEAEINQFNRLAGRTLQETVAARAALAIFVHRDNPIEEMTLAQLKSIYAGEITNWQSLGGNNIPIILLGADNLMGTHKYFCAKVMGETPVSSDFQLVSQLEELPARIALLPGAIGFGDANFRHRDIRVIKLKTDASTSAVMPLEKSQPNTNYPLTFQTYWYTTMASTESMQKFLQLLGN